MEQSFFFLQSITLAFRPSRIRTRYSVLSYCRQFTYKINDFLAGRRSENPKNPWSLKTKLPLFWGVGQTHTESGMHSSNYDGDNQSNSQYESTIVRKYESRRLRQHLCESLVGSVKISTKVS